MLQSEEVTNYELEELHAGLNALTHRMDQVLCRSPKEWWAQCVITMVFDGFIPLSSSCTCSLCQAEMAKKTMSYTKLVSSLKVKRKHNVQLLCRNSVPYSGKLSREKAFVNFAVLWLFMKVFSVKFGAWHSLVRHKWAIRKTFLQKSYFSPIHNSFSLESFPLYSIREKKWKIGSC